LIVAFDIVLATCVVPLLGCFYTKNPSPRAALISILGGAFCRIILEFVLPKDGYLIYPFAGDEFLDYGVAPSALLPPFIDANETQWWTGANKLAEPCVQRRFRDYTGVDSFSSFFLCLILYVGIQTIEKYTGPLFEFGGSKGYMKDTTEHPIRDKKYPGALGVTMSQHGSALNNDTSIHSAGRSTAVSFQDDSHRGVPVTVEEETPKDTPEQVGPSDDSVQECAKHDEEMNP
jgi:hypothetical protein